MAISQRPCAIATLIISLTSVVLVVSIISGQNAGLVYYVCNTLRYERGDMFEIGLSWILPDLGEQTAFHGYHYYSASPVGNVYGHAACNGNGTVNREDCIRCINFAYEKLQGYCPMSLGEQIQLIDCRIRYENYPITE